jgi:type IV pilus assembly protein PilM
MSSQVLFDCEVLHMIFQKKIAGLEISPDKIRVVELAQGSPKPRLLNVGSIDLPEGAVKDGFIKKPDEVSNSLKKLWKEAGINTKDVLLGLNNQYVLVRVANMPKTNPEHVDRSILFQAQDHLPVPLSTVELDYLVIDANLPSLHRLQNILSCRPLFFREA